MNGKNAVLYNYKIRNKDGELSNGQKPYRQKGKETEPELW